VFEIEQQAHQGLETTEAWAFALGPDAPSIVGFFPIGGELDADNGCDFDTCGAWTYSGAIRPAWSSASLFTVTYPRLARVACQARQGALRRQHRLSRRRQQTHAGPLGPAARLRRRRARQRTWLSRRLAGVS
jgi:hypothetical protein